MESTPICLWTIGHSTRPLEEFLEMLQTHGIRYLVDVRRFPASKRYPHFNGDSLVKSLLKASIAYEHVPNLGGRRQPRPDSVNLGWRNRSFRGYADYMLREEFRRALEELMAYSRKEETAIMCAEAVPWRCHRSLIADALVSHGWTVRHILSASKADAHKLASFAKVEQGVLTYPAPEPAQQTLPVNDDEDVVRER